MGYSLAYPRDWHVTSRVVATEFASDAQCESVQIIDSGPPPESGSIAVVLRSFVQVCRRPVADGSTLSQFMRRTYGEQLRLFESTELGGHSAFRTKSREADTTIFVQTDVHRLQVVASVNTDARMQPQRLREVQDILDSFSFIR